MEIDEYFDTLEQNLSSVSCSLDKINTLSKILQEILFDNTTFKIQDAQNIALILSQELHKLNSDISYLEQSMQNKRYSLK